MNDRILIIGDSHIDEKSIPELTDIFQEIDIIINREKPDWIVQLGDFYDKKKPTPKEIEFGTRIYTSWKTRGGNQTVILTGNHNQINEEESSIDYLKHFYCNVNKDYTIRADKTIYFGHFFVENSVDYDCYKHKMSDIQADFTFLGHYHDYKELRAEPFACHTGAIRYTSHAEKSEYKSVFIYEGNSIIRFPLETVIPIKTVYNIDTLINTPQRTKVRFIINDFNYLQKNIEQINKLKNNYEDFKLQLDLNKNIVKQEVTENKSDTEIINNYMSTVKNETIKNILIEEFKKENLI